MSKRSPQYDIGQRIEWIKAIAKRNEDGLRLLRLISPDVNQDYNDQVGFAKCQCVEQLVTSSNRSGKSVAWAAKMAAIARNEPLIALNGEEIDCRLPHHRDKTLTIWIIGNQFRHIGQTIFRLLFEDGAFSIIPDEDTGAWRAFKPWQEYDKKYSHLSRPAPPLIPPHLIDHDTWVWEHKGAKQVASVCLKNGTRFHFYPSTAQPKKGDPVHVIGIDEDIENSEHYSEWIARLTDYEGCLIWSSIIYRHVEALQRLIERAEVQQEEVDRSDPDRLRKGIITKVFHFTAKGNPHLSTQRLDVNREIYESEGDDIVAQRLDGGDIFDSTLIYPFFDKRVHTAIPADRDDWDDLAEFLHNHQGLPPVEWTHELAIDPGAQKPAVLFFATPPRVWKDKRGREWSFWNGNEPCFVPYDEIYGRRYTLADLVPLIKSKMRGIRFRRFIMDMQGGRISSMTGQDPAHRQFSRAFVEDGIESEETGVTFLSGGTEFQDRRRVVEKWMQIKSNGKPLLRIVTERCPNLCSQLQRNQYAMEGDVVTDKEARRERNDLRVSLEYVASRNPKYVHIDQTPPASRWIEEALKRRERFFGVEKKQERCHFGPGLAP